MAVVRRRCLLVGGPGRGKVEQGEQHKAGVALAGGQVDARLGVAEGVALVRPGVIFQVVVRADDGVVDDPEIGLAQFLVQGQAGVVDLGRGRGRALIQIGHVEGLGCRLCLRAGGCGGYVLVRRFVWHGRPSDGLAANGNYCTVSPRAMVE